MTTADAQAFFREKSGSAGTWEEDAHAYCDTLSIPRGMVMERLGVAAGVPPAYALTYWSKFAGISEILLETGDKLLQESGGSILI